MYNKRDNSWYPGDAEIMPNIQPVPEEQVPTEYAPEKGVINEAALKELEQKELEEELEEAKRNGLH